MSEKTVQVILNSTKAITGSANNNANFFIDWSAILEMDTPYKMHWTYVGGQNTYNGTKPALVSLNFNFEVYEAGSIGGAQSSNIVGFLKPVVISGGTNTCFLTAETNTNEPIYMERRPLNSFLNVKIVDANGNLWLDNAATPVVPALWVLTLHFIKADKP